MTGHAEEEAEPVDPTEYFTYWGKDVASRLDRVYVSDEWTAKVQWVEVAEPAAPSDHQRVLLHLQETDGRTKRRHRKRGLTYPPRQRTRTEQWRDYSSSSRQ
jgi:Ni/Co efflux regulator RcnB